MFHIPGIAITIIKDGQLILNKGYGLRSLRTKQAVMPQTLFGIGSNSKAFTAAAVGLLVEEGKTDGHQQQWVKDCKLGYGTYTSSSFGQSGLVRLPKRF